MKINRNAMIWRSVDRFSKTIVPILAIFLTVYTVLATQKHDRLSVTPKLSFADVYDKDGISISVENWGTGPAVIRDFSIENEASLQSADYFTTPAQVVQRFSPTYFIKKESARLAIITAAGNTFKKGPDDMWELLTQKVIVHIEYCSIYGECWAECSRPPDFLCGRTDSPAKEILDRSWWSRLL